MRKGVYETKEKPTIFKMIGEDENLMDKIKHGADKRFTRHFFENVRDSWYIQKKHGTKEFCTHKIKLSIDRVKNLPDNIKEKGT